MPRLAAIAVDRAVDTRRVYHGTAAAVHVVPPRPVPTTLGSRRRRARRRRGGRSRVACRTRPAAARELQAEELGHDLVRARVDARDQVVDARERRPRTRGALRAVLSPCDRMRSALGCAAPEIADL